MNLIYKVLVLFKPKYYNYITGLVVISGLGLIGTPLLEQIINSLLETKFNIQITEKNDTYIGLILVLLGLIYHLVASHLSGNLKTENNDNDKIKSRINVINGIRHELAIGDFDVKGFRESLNYSRIRPYLNPTLVKSIESDNITIQAGGRGGGVQNYKSKILDELSKLESEWGQF